jgi:hypothetical protein
MLLIFESQLVVPELNNPKIWCQEQYNAWLAWNR